MLSMTAPTTKTLSQRLRARLAEFAQTLQTWPWLDTARTLRERFREDRLGLTASSLTFTTLVSLVPLVAVMLAVFSAFPMFASFQVALEKYFLQSLVPEGIAKPVLGALTQFAAKAARLGSAGLVFLLVAALALVLTIDRALNAIWRVRQPRPLTQRVLIYWAALTLGPLVLGVSLTLTSYVITVGQDIVKGPVGGVGFLIDVVQFALLAGGAAALFHYVPNTHVRWRHAVAGGVFVAVGFDIAKRVLAWYVKAVPTFSSVYGAFATVPILLLWVYVGWLIVLWGAVIAAYAPSLSMHIARLSVVPGHRFSLSLSILRALARVQGDGAKGLSMHELAATLATDPLQIEPVAETLVTLDWVGVLDEAGDKRLVLLVQPASAKLAPLVQALLLQDQRSTERFSAQAGLDQLLLGDVL
jgi:membrane protein